MSCLQKKTDAGADSGVVAQENAWLEIGTHHGLIRPFNTFKPQINICLFTALLFINMRYSIHSMCSGLYKSNETLPNRSVVQDFV